MSRVLIIGSSHVAAYRAAAAEFAAQNGDVALDFFAMRGPVFHGSAFDEAGVFHPNARHDKYAQEVLQINGRATVEAAGFDDVLIVGHRFAATALLPLLEQSDVLGAPRQRPRLVSRALIEDALQAVVAQSVAEAQRSVAALGRPVCFAIAPYPARSITERAPGFALARMLQDFWSRPEADWIFELWQEALQNALTAHGHRLLLPPPALCAGPFALDPALAQSPPGLGHDGTTDIDHRHMNAAYGLAMLQHYTTTLLGQAGAMPAAPDTHDKIKERTA